MFLFLWNTTYFYFFNLKMINLLTYIKAFILLFHLFLYIVITFKTNMQYKSFWNLTTDRLIVRVTHKLTDIHSILNIKSFHNLLKNINQSKTGSSKFSRIQCFLLLEKIEDSNKIYKEHFFAKCLFFYFFQLLSRFFYFINTDNT